LSKRKKYVDEINHKLMLR